MKESEAQRLKGFTIRLTIEPTSRAVSKPNRLPALTDMRSSSFNLDEQRWYHGSKPFRPL